MTAPLLYALAGACLFALGLHAVLARRHLFWKVLALNIMGSGVFLVLIGAPARPSGAAADPVPQALVLTGIVVTVSATALALGLALRVAAKTGRAHLPEDADA